MARADQKRQEGISVALTLIQPLFPNKPRGVARVDDRRVLNGIFRVLRTGSPWRNLLDRYGPLCDCLQPAQPLVQGKHLGPGD